MILYFKNTSTVIAKKNNILHSGFYKSNYNKNQNASIVPSILTEYLLINLDKTDFNSESFKTRKHGFLWEASFGKFPINEIIPKSI